MDKITLYNPVQIACNSYDPQATEVARLVGELIRNSMPEVEVEHIGSTSVPECPGKGYIDLMVLYPEQGLESAKYGLAALGFQRQTSRDPFPEERPMRVGSFVFGDKNYPLHVHVLAMKSSEVEEFRWFREKLKADARLRQSYAVEKRRILAAGITDSVDYSICKERFVQSVLAMRDSTC